MTYEFCANLVIVISSNDIWWTCSHRLLWLTKEAIVIHKPINVIAWLSHHSLRLNNDVTLTRIWLIHTSFICIEISRLFVTKKAIVFVVGWTWPGFER